MSAFTGNGHRANGAGSPGAKRAVGERSSGADVRSLVEALSRPRGRRPPHPLEVENARLKHRLAQAESELEKARKVIEVQGNVSALLGELLETRSANPEKNTGK